MRGVESQRVLRALECIQVGREDRPVKEVLIEDGGSL